MKTYTLPEELRNGLLNYLTSRPWREVDEGVRALMALEPIPTGSTDAERVLAEADGKRVT